MEKCADFDTCTAESKTVCSCCEKVLCSPTKSVCKVEGYYLKPDPEAKQEAYFEGGMLRIKGNLAVCTACRDARKG